MREGALAICSEVDAIFFVLGTKCLVLRGERLASAGVCVMTGAVGRWGAERLPRLQRPGCPGRSRRHDRVRQGRTPLRGNTRFVSDFAEIFPDRRYCHEAGGWFGFDRLIFVLRTWYEVLGLFCLSKFWVLGRAAAGTLSALARQGGSTKEHSVRVHFVRFEPARSGGSPTSKSPPPTSVSLRSTS